MRKLRKKRELWETHHPVELNPTKAVNPASTIIDHLKNVRSKALPCFRSVGFMTCSMATGS